MTTPSNPDSPREREPDDGTGAEPADAASATVWASPDDAAAPVGPVPPPSTPPGPSPPPGAVPPGPPMNAPAPPAPAGPRQTSRLAIITLVTGLLGLVPLAIAFGIAALVRLRRGAEKGRNLAIGGLAACLAWAVAGTFVTVLALGTSLERDAAGTIRAGGEARFSELREGDCFTGYTVDRTEPVARPGTVLAVPCTEPHTGEVIARVPLTRPADFEEASLLCRGKSVYLRKSQVRRSLEPYIGLPTTSQGTDVICAMHHAGRELTTPLVDTVDTGLKVYQELTPGTCLGRSAYRVIVPTVPCSEMHWDEVFATYEISVGGTYAPGDLPPRPDEGTLRIGTQRRCIAEAEKIFATIPPEPRLRVAAMWPTPEDWELGILTVVCYWSATGEGMEGSLMPE